jgi:trimeric autotransporter adhesin
MSRNVHRSASTVESRLLGCLLFLLFASQGQAATFIVNAITDPVAPLTVGCDATECTLREAITAANASAGADQIDFNIAGAGEQMIALTSALPAITQALYVDGYSQPGTSFNTHATDFDAVLAIRVDGQLATSATGLLVCVSNVVVRGLAVTRFAGSAIRVGGNGCAGGTYTGVQISGNILGLATDGVTAAGNATSGVDVRSAVAIVGGNALSERNLIGANSSGVGVYQTSSNGALVLNNLIGTDRTGLLDRGNSVGVVVSLGISGAVIGSADAPNRIAYGVRGTEVVGSSIDNAHFANRILGQSALGIDLRGTSDSGVTANDPDDTDNGANGLQNFPLIASLILVPGGIQIAGTLDVGNPTDAPYQISAYSSARCNASGNGPGEFYLGTQTVNLSSANETFNLTYLTAESLGGRNVITMTAHRAGQGTSEFSACVRIDPAAAVNVNVTDDANDGSCSASHCSLREAIIEANGAAGADYIHFGIPGAGPHRINLLSALPSVTGPTIIDGYTQPGASVNTHVHASNAVLKVIVDAGGYSSGSSAMLNLPSTATGSIVRGLSIVDVRNGAPAVQASGDIRVQGNWFGIEPDGVTTGTLSGPAVRLDGSGTLIGGPLIEHRNVMVASTSSFGAINTTAGGSDQLIESNLIGLRPDGVTGQANLNGLLRNGGLQTHVVVRNNTISCNSGSVFGFGTSIEGNRFGSSSDGAGNPGCSSGRAATGANSIWVDNLFAFHTARAVEVGSSTSGVVFSRNRLFSNATFDFDLSADGHSINDPLDADTGANNLQNFPVLTSARRISDTQLEISGTLSSLANTSFRIEFFGNSAITRTALSGSVLLADARWTGNEDVVVTTEGNGEASFGPITINFPGATKVNVVSATATRLDGASNPVETSELGPAIASFAAGGTDLVVTNTLASGDGSFFAAVLEANSRPDSGSARDRITFNIPGSGPHLITPLQSTLNLIDRIEIDGYSEPGSAMNTLAVGSNAAIAIELRATSLNFGNASDALIRGIAMTGTAPASQPWLLLNVNAVLEGCFIGVQADGNTLSSNLTSGGSAISCTSSGCGRIGGVALAARNLLGVNASANVAAIRTAATAATTIENNIIGLRRNGSTRLMVPPSNPALATASRGIHSLASISPSSGDSIIGNIIGGLGIGIRLDGAMARVTGNRIGVDADVSTAVANGGPGIWVKSGADHLIGDNVIAGNTGDGIELASAAASVSMIDNRMLANGGLAIDLDGDGITLNDAGDPDAGANARQNFPVIGSAIRDSDGVVISGTLNALPDTDFRIRFCYVTGNTDSHGECTRTIVDTFVAVRTDNDGNANFSSPAMAFAAGFTHVTASAARVTAHGEETSEFAQNVAILRRSAAAIQSTAPQPIRFGTAFSTSIVVSTAVAGAAPTGSVTVSTTPDVGGCTIAALSAGAGSCNITPTGSGAVTLVATYGGDVITHSSAASQSLTVEKAATTTSILSDAADPSAPGEQVTVTLSVTSSGGTPIGAVTVIASGGGDCSANLSGGTGNCLLTPTSAGPLILTATYAGNANFDSSSDTETHSVGAASSTLQINASTPNPSVFGQAVTVSATLSSAFGTPAGPIVISDSAGASCEISGSSGSCALMPTNVGDGLILRADFAGDSAHGASAATVLQVVNRADTTLTASLPFLSGDPGELPIQFLPMRVPVTIAVAAPGAGSPSGTIVVSAVAPEIEICVITLPATFCDLTPTTAGVRDFTATYNGDAKFNGSDAVLDTPVLDSRLFANDFECVGVECPAGR